MSLIKSPKERMERADEKRRLLLRFLRDEIYTTPRIAAAVMGVGERAARATVAAMEKARHVRRHSIRVMPMLPPITIVGITELGQLEAMGDGDEFVTRVFQPARVSILTLTHTLDTQQLRLEAVGNEGIEKWVATDRIIASSKGVAKPDAIILTKSGQRIAIEVERTIKSLKRYTEVLAGHLKAIQQNKWDRVIWTSPNVKTANTVARMVKSIKYVKISGVNTKIDPAKHHSRLSFCDYDNFKSHI